MFLGCKLNLLLVDVDVVLLRNVMDYFERCGGLCGADGCGTNGVRYRWRAVQIVCGTDGVRYRWDVVQMGCVRPLSPASALSCTSPAELPCAACVALAALSAPSLPPRLSRSPKTAMLCAPPCV